MPRDNPGAFVYYLTKGRAIMSTPQTLTPEPQDIDCINQQIGEEQPSIERAGELYQAAQAHCLIRMVQPEALDCPCFAHVQVVESK
jgi:hypothetical protein